jgi:hypothetical protein
MKKTKADPRAVPRKGMSRAVRVPFIAIITALQSYTFFTGCTILIGCDN